MRDLVIAVLHPHRYRWGLRPWTRHSIVLVVAGVVHVAVGLSYMFTELNSTRAAALIVALKLAPITAWGCGWVVVGLCAVLSARWPPASEKWGYSMLSSIAALWAVFMAAAPLLGSPTQALTGALVWALMAFLWWAIAGLWNPDPGLVRLTSHDREADL